MNFDKMKESNGKTILFLSIAIALLVIIASSTGLFLSHTYSNETFNWATQSLAQDVIDLFLIMPSLIITAVLAYRKNKIPLLLWTGVIFSLIYTFVIYCFALHFNKLFIFYCVTL